MGTTEPIRDPAELTKFREYYHTEHPQTRNYALIMLGLHSALRISDLLHLRWLLASRAMRTATTRMHTILCLRKRPAQRQSCP